MAKKASNAQSKMGTVSNLPSTKAAGTSGDELEQIQNLLFGAQAREIDSNLQALEQRFDDRLAQMTRSYEAQIQALNNVIVRQAKKAAEASLSEYSALMMLEIESVRSQAGSAMLELREQQEQASADSNNHLDAALAKLDAQWQQQNSLLASEFRQKHSVLDGCKLDKKALSSLLGEMASGLN